MDDDNLDEEFSIIYEEPDRIKILDSDTFRTPIKNLKLRKPIMLDPEQTVQEAVSIMMVKQFGCILVTSISSELVGILTERDVIMKIPGIGRTPDAIKISEIMTRNPESLQPEDPIAYAMNAMHVGGYRHVPVVDGKNVPLAVVSVKDIIGFIVENFPQEILNLPPKPLRTTSREDGG
jgi:CBS domain-containing protein